MFIQQLLGTFSEQQILVKALEMQRCMHLFPQRLSLEIGAKVVSEGGRERGVPTGGLQVHVLLHNETVEGLEIGDPERN